MNSKHQETLLKLCRVCANLLGKKCYDVVQYTEDLRKVFYVNTSNDCRSIHPPNFCLKCYSAVLNSRKRGSTTTIIVFANWTSHLDTNCEICKHHEDLKSGIIGKQKFISKKNVKKGRSSTNELWSQEKLNQILESSPKYNLPANIKYTDFSLSDNPNLALCKCFLCNNILNQPVIIKGCEHVFCFLCLGAILRGQSIINSTCPQCNQSIKVTDVTPSNYINNMVHLLTLSCKKCTAKFVAATQFMEYTEHVEHCSANNISCSLNTVETNSLSTIYSLTPESTIPRNLEDAALHVIKTKIAQSNLPNNAIKFKSGGPFVSISTFRSFVFMKIQFTVFHYIYFFVFDILSLKKRAYFFHKTAN